MARPMMNARSSTRWVFDISAWTPTETQWFTAVSCLQSEERDRISRFVFQKDAKSSLVGRLMMRKFVAENTCLTYDKIRFERDDRGKPYLVGDMNLSFNISHQGNYTVLAGELSTCKLGVDVMKIEYSGGKSLSEFFRIMTRNFSSSEWKFIREPHDDNAKLCNFCRHWCLKESYVKATGTGITVDLQQISFSPRTRFLQSNVITSDTLLSVNGVLQDKWHFHETLLDNDHCVTVATEEDFALPLVVPKDFTFLNFNDLVKDCVPLCVPDVNECKTFFSKGVSPR